MLDIGFSELMLIGVVALVVLGPERLPRVARTAGHLLGRFQRYVSDVKSDINREIELAELKKIQTSVEDAARSIESSVRSEFNQAEDELRNVETEVNRAGDEIRKTQAELTETVNSMAMPHMGMAPREELPAPEVSEQATRTAELEEPSPQLELGLAQDERTATAEPSKPS